MATFTWTAKNKKTGKSGGRLTRQQDLTTVEELKAYVELHFPNVEVSDIKLVTEDAPAEPDGAKEHPDARPPSSVDGKPVRLSPVPAEDFQVGAAEAARVELAALAGDHLQPE